MSYVPRSIYQPQCARPFPPVHRNHGFFPTCVWKHTTHTHTHFSIPVPIPGIYICIMAERQNVEGRKLVRLDPVQLSNMEIE